MIILVTGATAGFGRTIARRFAADGAKIIAAGRREERLAELRTELGDSVLPLMLDVRDREAVAKAIESLPPEWSEIDVCVNNAGLALGVVGAQAASLDDWDQMVDTNIKGLMYVTHAVLPGMVVRNRGHVINIGSTAGEFPYPGGNVYGASKAFVRQFSLNLRADLVGIGVRATDIEPGLTGGTEFSQVRFHGDAARRPGLCRHQADDRRRYRRGGSVGGRLALARQHQPHRNDADLPGPRPARRQARRLSARSARV
ncbi:MAG: oxidoreductase, short chain dehydrogenase/reductase family [Rubritepida sp.]|nr:oxidoreductase, short chain dehydrogenase/reductase family [Rubritepida sp.]